MKYKLGKEFGTGVSQCVNKFIDDKQVLSIPLAEDNTDYQEYLAWVAEGNTPDPADE